MMKLYIEAYMGDSGDEVRHVKVFTDEKLTESTIPNLQEVERESCFVSTQSWADIDWEDNFVAEQSSYNEMFLKEYKVFNAPPDEPFIGIVFDSEHDCPNYKRALFSELEANLLMRVQENCYEEKISHNGTKCSVEYVYILSEKLFI